MMVASPTIARSPRVAPTPIPAAAPGLSSPLLLAAGLEVDEVLGAVEIGVNVVLWKSVDWNRTWTLYAFNAPMPQVPVVVDGLAVTPLEMKVITVEIVLNRELHPIVVSQ